MLADQVIRTWQGGEQFSDACLIALSLEQVQHHANCGLGFFIGQASLCHNRVNQFLHLPTTFTCLLFWSR